ncbi:MAG: hypothetical protein RMH77_06095 [Sulfolobales archaeon]|nr:hypothetical protein [Sulfolobales archaeon]MDW7969955.1 hypothetical protein [Sulfolobales archaeon]
MNVDELMKWLSRFGELVTMGVRISKECNSLCYDLSLRYLTILISLDVVNFCSYLNFESEAACYDRVLDVCDEAVVRKIESIVEYGRKLSLGEYVELDLLESVNNELPGIYLCLSRIVANEVSVFKPDQ